MDTSDAPIRLNTTDGGYVEVTRNDKAVLIKVECPTDYDAITLRDNIEKTMNTRKSVYICIEAAD
jgi:tRNA G26 N,N-dimethylase Trm1